MMSSSLGRRTKNTLTTLKKSWDDSCVTICVWSFQSANSFYLLSLMPRYGHHITLVTDHKPLTAILGPKKGPSSSQITRMGMDFSCIYSYDIIFHPTGEHANADGHSQFRLFIQHSTDESSSSNSFPVESCNSIWPSSQQGVSLHKKMVTFNTTLPEDIYRVVVEGWLLRGPRNYDKSCSKTYIKTILEWYT